MTRDKMDCRQSLRKFGLGVVIFGFIFLSGIQAQNSDARSFSENENVYLPSESSRTVRVMVHKEFQLQPDGTYKEIPSESQKTVLSPRSDTFADEMEESYAESAPSVQYLKTDYNPYYREYYGDGPSMDDYNNYMAAASSLTPYVIRPQNAPLNRFRYANNNDNNNEDSFNEVVATPTTFYSSTSNPTTNYVVRGNGSQPQNNQKQNNNHQQYNLQQQGAPEYYVDDGQLRPMTPSEQYTIVPLLNESQPEGSEVKTHYSAPSETKWVNVNSYTYSPQQVDQGQGSPSNIQEILKKDVAASQNSHYYSPKDSYYDQPEVKLPIISEYDTTGSAGYSGQSHGSPISAHVQTEYHQELKPDGEYGVPAIQGGGGSAYGVPATGGSYGVPATGSAYGVPATGSDGGYSGHQGGYEEQSYGNQGGHGGYGHQGTKAGIVGSIAQTVKGVTAQKAHQFQEVIQQKGEVGSQLLKHGGYAVKAAVNGKAEKAKVIVNVLGQAPHQISSFLSSKAKIASAALAHGSKKLGAIVQVKAQVANQASHFIQAKGKAASIVIKASGGTAADLILAKGKGLASLIKSGGRTAAAILNHKGNAVSHVANAIGSLTANKGGIHGGGWGAQIQDVGHQGGYETHGGYESQDAPVIEQTPKPFEQFQYALKSVAESPASSYGSPPAGHYKMQSAFKSMFNNFKSSPQNNPVGAYSDPVGVTASQESEGGSGASFKDSLTKMSEMFTNISKVFKRLSPNSKEQN